MRVWVLVGGVRVGVGMGMGVKGGCGYGWNERCDECRWCGLLRFSFCFIKKGQPIAEIFPALPDGQDLHLDVPAHEFCEFNQWRDSQTIAQIRFSCNYRFMSFEVNSFP